MKATNLFIFLLLILATVSCAKNKDTEEVENTPPSPTVEENSLLVVVDFTRVQNEGQPLTKDLLGTYSPQKWVNAQKIYDKTNVLDPLSVPFHKVNLPNVYNIASDGTWKDINDGGQPSQKTILKLLQSAGVGIHLGIESVPREMRGDAGKVQKLHRTALTKVREYLGGDENIYFEILNEPELPTSVEWGYYPDFDLFWSDFLNAYIALANERLEDPNLHIGGPGFELDRWLGQFMGKLTDPATNKVELSDGLTHTIDLDFISYHNYLNWDNAPIAEANTKAARDKMNQFYNGTAAYRDGHPEVKLFCTEYSWLKSPQDPVNDAANNSYRSCARTLALIKLAVDKLDLTNRFYWAQSMGQKADFGEDYFTLENYDWNSGKYQYRAGFYAFWLYQKMAKKRNYLSFDESKLDGMASSKKDELQLVLWNITGTHQTVKLDLQNINLTDYNYELYSIDSSSYQYVNGNEKLPKLTKSGRADKMGTITLEMEATVYIKLSRN